MGASDRVAVEDGKPHEELTISVAAPVADGEAKNNEELCTRESHSSTSNSQGLGGAVEFKVPQKGSHDLEKATPPPYTASDTQTGEVNPFGHEDENAEMKYQTMEWWNAGLLMVAENISLGVLSLPQAVSRLGLFPGIFLTVVLGLMSTYCGYVIGQFYLKFPSTHTFADAAFLMGGPIAREVMGVAQCLIIIFIQAAHVLSFSIAMNVLTDHGTCSVVFGVVGFVVCLALALKRQLEKVSHLSMASCCSVIICVVVAMIGIAITKPDPGHVVAVNHDATLKDGMLAALQIILAYAGHVAFFTFCSELRKPQDFPKALCFMQVLATTFYVLVGAIIYYYAGPGVLSPALGSASPTVAKIAFGLALPTIVIAGVVNGHVGCKYVWVRLWRKNPARMHEKYGLPLVTWIAICTVSWLISWLISEAIPSFSLLLGLISALFCSWFSFGFSGGLWLFMNKGRYAESWKKMLLTALNVYILCQGATICGLGLYASGAALAEGDGGAPFSCANNYNP